MTECEEVAAAMLPKYMEYKRSLAWEFQGHSSEGIRQWVLRQLKDTESYTVINNVTEALQKRVMQDRVRKDGKLAHVWMLGKELGFNSASRLHNTHVCRDCGVLKGAPNSPETPCKGIVKITLRDENKS